MSTLSSSLGYDIFKELFKNGTNAQTPGRNDDWIFSTSQLSILDCYAGSSDAGVGFLIMEIPDFHRIALASADEKAFELFGRLVQETRRMFNRHFTECRWLFFETYGLGEKALFFEYPKEKSIQLAQSYFSLLLEFDAMAEQETGRILGEPAEVRLGYSIIAPADSWDIPRSLIRGLCEARHFARTKFDEGALNRYWNFLNLIEEQTLSTVYQPIIDFSTGDTIGWEAFARSPGNDRIYSPTAIFGFAEHIGAVYELDRRCRELAIRNVGKMTSDQLLFINIHHLSFHNKLLSPEALANFLVEYGLKPGNIVLEISERQNLSDAALLCQAIEPYCQKGFKISIDDVDGGKSSLSFLFQVRPDFLKIDSYLVRGVDADPFKRLMVEMILYIAKKIETQVIAVGLESENEFSSLVSMGVRAGQGFLLSGPEAEKKEVTVKVPTGASWSKVIDSGKKCSKVVRDMIEIPITVSRGTRVEDVKNMVETRFPSSNVVVVEGTRPVGQMMCYELDRRLGTRYGCSLYLHRDIAHLMNENPLIVDSDSPVEDVAKKAMNRQGSQIYDDIIVKENEALLGTVSVQRLLDYMAQFQVELAKGCNPLTGLPGNLAIEHEIERRMKIKIPSSLIYIDLDNFKVYNDVYGFGKGDQVILMTSDVLKKAVEEMGGPHDFIGHVGGDDFIIISEHALAEGIGHKIIEHFEKKIVEFYTDMHRKAGYIIAVGRDGIRRKFRFVSLSIGVLDFDFETDFTLLDLSHRVAAVKKYAKTKDGNRCVRERRSPLGLKGNEA